MPFIWYGLMAMWPSRILRAAPSRLLPISTHANSHGSGRSSVACVLTTTVACRDRHQYTALLVQASKVNFERLLTDSEMLATWPRLAVPFARLSFPGARDRRTQGART